MLKLWHILRRSFISQLRGSGDCIASNLSVRSRICAGLSSGGPQYYRFMVSCSILTRSLWYLLDDSYEVEIKRGRLGRREKGTESSVLIGGSAHGVWFDAGAIFGGISDPCSVILKRVC